jgi:chromatin structure-remodeling complex subunit RSC9
MASHSNRISSLLLMEPTHKFSLAETPTISRTFDQDSIRCPWYDQFLRPGRRLAHSIVPLFADRGYLKSMAFTISKWVRGLEVSWSYGPDNSITNYFAAGYPGPSLMHRVTMSLKSELPDDVEYAMGQLVRISHDAGDELRAEHWPALCETLFRMLGSVVQLVKVHGTEDTVYSAEYTEKLEKIINAALILRNMSLNTDNSKRFALVNWPKDILLEGLKLPDYPNLTELRNYLLEITEGVAGWLPFGAGDTLLDVLAEGLGSKDRGKLLGSMRAICRLVVGRDDFNRLGEIPFTYITRITNLLMLEDDELVSACLDFLYQYTTHEENIEKLMQPPEGHELVRQLVRLLLFQGITGEQLVYIKMVKKPRPPVHDIPHLPNEIVQDLLTYAEPERATKWYPLSRPPLHTQLTLYRMRCCFEEDPDADITQIALWQAYQARFNEYVSAGFPLLPAAEFIKNVSVAFQTASAMVLPTTQGQKFIIKGIRARETPMSTKGHIYLACKWFNTPGNAVSKCTAQLATPQDLWAHILGTHLTPPADSSVAGRPLWCNWAGCPRFGTDGEKNRFKVIAHVRTHMPDMKKPRTVSREEQEMLDDPDARVIIRRCQTVTDERGEAGGIPLTSILVLRNLSKRGGATAKMLIDSSREDLAEVMAVNKPLATWVGDLLVGGLSGVE